MAKIVQRVKVELDYSVEEYGEVSEIINRDIQIDRIKNGIVEMLKEFGGIDQVNINKIEHILEIDGEIVYEK